MDHEINNDTPFSVSSSMSIYLASSKLLVLSLAPFCYTLVGQITLSQELRWGQNNSIRTHIICVCIYIYIYIYIPQNEGYIELNTWREIASVQYNSRCEFILIDSVIAGCNMSCSEEKNGFCGLRMFCTKRKRAEFK